ncbi:phosphoribosylanthranilate isomerase [Tepidimonas taiwanensis]|uniref:N-(5'-phosphoribosyl)anthranilate isomerase n=1 Tax=Tepidimonas taiwanensis TaxID=307486 RepID=A0A554XEE7_9BURK|nr:phosphoribosylanthranilate isomerase [Tepidimonas taiwanensis]MCX7692076.1 phosphoribosylanthranilate isomerase [Tepidimonas taiwanensis]MDM7464261.1 phosphoribosylanthranilate isomerase [Tepidimonas taiwanensis]TSE34195.1 N-(5'-phosphoribosyl)anthranilate isomerase [Tepidimonas taiwanensis]UBQ04836.1 phosphoribosylanthranilate isomerase [Tepidimonas taiwanensis]
MRRTRIKICGLTREADVEHAAAAGADAIGFVLYPGSPRYVDARRAGALARRLPACVTPVLLFVNASADDVAAALDAVPHAVLQFHGDETPAQCAALAGTRPWWRAARVPVGAGAGAFDLLEYAERHAAAQAVLVDAHVPGYGGGGQSFDWTAFPWSHPRLRAADRVVLSGGLTPENVTDGVRLVRPWAVDVSSGVEAAKGIKDPARVTAFIAAVRRADQTLTETP